MTITCSSPWFFFFGYSKIVLLIMYVRMYACIYFMSITVQINIMTLKMFITLIESADRRLMRKELH